MADQGLTEKEAGRRQSARYKTNVPAILTTDKSESQIDIIQISRAGCLVFPPILPFTDPNVDITFQLDEGCPLFGLRAKSSTQSKTWEAASPLAAFRRGKGTLLINLFQVEAPLPGCWYNGPYAELRSFV